MQTIPAAFLALLLGMPMMANSDVIKPQPFPMIGSWGGDRVNAHFNTTGAVFEYDCAKGLINQPVTRDSAGGFKVRGTHENYRPGPDLVDQAPSLKSAAYQGVVVDTVLTLTVRIDGDPELHTYRLEKNRNIKLARCL